MERDEAAPRRMKKGRDPEKSGFLAVRRRQTCQDTGRRDA